jgi:hypothetical protein
MLHTYVGHGMPVKLRLSAAWSVVWWDNRVMGGWRLVKPGAYGQVGLADNGS